MSIRRYIAPPRTKGLLQGVREDYRLAERMAYGRRLCGENVTNVSDDELMARVAAAYVSEEYEEPYVSHTITRNC